MYSLPSVSQHRVEIQIKVKEVFIAGLECTYNFNMIFVKIKKKGKWTKWQKKICYNTQSATNSIRYII